MLQPELKCFGSSRIGCERLAARPFDLQRTIQALSFAVLRRTVRSDEHLLYAQLGNTMSSQDRTDGSGWHA